MQSLMAVESKVERSRCQLVGPGPVLALGAHDALSAKLAEEAGFDAIWASGFGISAASALPDANVLTMTETLEEEIAEWGLKDSSRGGELGWE